MGRLQVECSFCNKPISRIKTKTETYFCDTNCKAEWQVLQREKQGYTKEWLCNQYFELGKDCNQIGREIGRCGKSVWNWFKGYGIEINKRGTYYEKNLCLDGSSWIGKKHTDETKSKIKEARLKDGHVPYLKNGKHWLKGLGKENHPNYKGGLTPERQSLYSSEEWSDAVKKVWERDNATCQNCGKHHNTQKSRGNFHIHHIVSFQVRELRCVVSNLVLLCKQCHLWIHSKNNTEQRFIKTQTQ